MILTIIFLAITAICLLGLVYLARRLYKSTHPIRIYSAQNPLYPYGKAYHDITFYSEDFLQLHGWFVPNINSDTIIIICHGYLSAKSGPLDSTIFLSDTYNLFYFDFRGHGLSSGTHTTIGQKETLDLKAAINWAALKGFKKIGIFGISMGGTITLLCPDDRVSAIIVDSPFASFRQMVFYDCRKKILANLHAYLMLWMIKHVIKINTNQIEPLFTIEKIKCPIFLFHSIQDERTPYTQAQQLIQKKPDIELWEIPTGEHCKAYENFPDIYADKILDFFKKNL